MCIPTFVDYFLFNLFFFSLFLSFSFSFFSFLVARRVLIAFFFSFFFVRSLPDSFIPRFIPIFFSSGFFFILVNGAIVKRYPLTPTTLSLSSNHVFLAGRWSTSGWGGNAHFFTYTRIRSRETGENKQTNKHEQTWGYQEQRKVCNTTCMCIPDSRYGLTLAWVTSENSTMLLE